MTIAEKLKGWLAQLYARLSPLYAPQFAVPQSPPLAQPLESEWAEHEARPFSKTELIDGSVHDGTGLLMRRKAQGGSWQYRLPTQKETYQNWLDGHL
jgi:hypothetical protein